MTVKLDRRLHEILSRDGLERFSAVELRDAYIDEQGPSEALKPAMLWKHIYRQLNRLVNRGLLAKQEDPTGRRSTYTKTPEFHKAEFKLLAETPRTVRQEKRSASGQSDRQLIHQLKERAKQYQVDLSASIGESEEYMQLYDTYPVLKPQLESQYLKARERSSRLLGQLRAVENILADCGTHA